MDPLLGSYSSLKMGYQTAGAVQEQASLATCFPFEKLNLSDFYQTIL